ncbi:MAG: 2OG-Fe(II) oxygenase [Thermosynechococcaceae cyanobacterium]
MNQQDLATLIAQRIDSQFETSKFFFEDCQKIKYFYIDDLLPISVARQIFSSFPKKETMLLRKDLREFKYMTAQMNLVAPILEELVFAFHDPQVVQRIAQITGIASLIPDPELYAGGITLMPEGGFMNPHIDNSHDRDRRNYRVLNLLYYVTPDWQTCDGGNFELWPDGLKRPPIEITSCFNRLLVMLSTPQSLHSVNTVKTDRERCCVVNYYFSPVAPHLNGDRYYQSTSFRGRPKQWLRDAALRVDGKLRTTGRQILDPLFKRRILQNPHFYNPSIANPSVSAAEGTDPLG